MLTIATRALILGLFFFCLNLHIAAAPNIRPGPIGIMELTTVDPSIHALKTDPGWTNKNVKGFLIRMSWSTVEPSQGEYDFSVFNEACVLAAAHHKTVGLSVGAGDLSPTWIYAANAQPFSFTQSNGSIAIMPLPWDPIFQSTWSDLIAALGQHYARKQVVRYIVMTGIGRDFESSEVVTDTDVANFNALGGQTLWGPAAEAIANFYAASFPRTHLICAMDPPIPGTIGHTMMNTYVNDMFAAYPHQFGVACASLTAGTNAQTPSVSYIQAEYAHTTCGFQMFGPSNTLTSTLAAALEVGVGFKAHYIEVYPYDCNLKSQQSALAAANIGLAANSAFHP